MPTETLTITDNRTGKSYELPITDGSIKASDLRQIKLNQSDYGLMSYDPAFTNTASTRSAITYLDGDNGKLYYRGYPIEQLAEKSTHLETAYLVLNGELPTAAQLASWEAEIKKRWFIHENIKHLIDAFRHDAHPMGMFISAVGASSSFHPESAAIFDPAIRNEQIVRLIAEVPTIAAFSYRHIPGLPGVYPDDELS
jgi:citrate synthase